MRSCHGIILEGFGKTTNDVTAVLRSKISTHNASDMYTNAEILPVTFGKHKVRLRTGHEGPERE